MFSCGIDFSPARLGKDLNLKLTPPGRMLYTLSHRKLPFCTIAYTVCKETPSSLEIAYVKEISPAQLQSYPKEMTEYFGQMETSTLQSPQWWGLTRV